jgi:hypothetical protein
MDGQGAGNAGQRGNAPTEQEIADLRRFLGNHTAANRPGVHSKTGERPDNVRPLASRRDREID